MRDEQPNIEDRATQPMEAGGWVSQWESPEVRDVDVHDWTNNDGISRSRGKNMERIWADFFKKQWWQRRQRWQQWWQWWPCDTYIYLLPLNDKNNEKNNDDSNDNEKNNGDSNDNEKNNEKNNDDSNENEKNKPTVVTLFSFHSIPQKPSSVRMQFV